MHIMVRKVKAIADSCTLFSWVKILQIGLPQNHANKIFADGQKFAEAAEISEITNSVCDDNCAYFNV